MDEKPNCTPQPNLAAQAVGCIKNPSIVNCVAKPLVKTAIDPCVQNHIIHNGLQDPYIQNMPKHDTIEAIQYSAQMGGEHFDGGCQIM